MNKNTARRSIYLRTFCALAAIYLVLMTGFTLFLLFQEKKAAQLQMKAFALQANGMVESVLKDHRDSSGQLADEAGFRKALLEKWVYFISPETELAIYTGEYDLLYHTGDHWLVGYTERTEGSTNYMGYAQLNVRDWFSEKEADELEHYWDSQLEKKAYKEGDLFAYDLQMRGFWLDGDMAIPDKITVTPMYAQGFHKTGDVSLSYNGTPEETLVYSSSFADAKDLPYFEFGTIQPVNILYSDRELQLSLRNLALDREMLMEASKGQPGTVSSERISRLNYRLYLLQPYQNTVHMTDDNSYTSDYWTVYARQVNLLEKSGATLLYVGTGGLVMFIAAALILSAQTYRTYRRREELERSRQETANALAHDLKTPLSIISGYAQNLLEHVHTEKREQYASGILTNVNRMDHIIRGMLELSKLESVSGPVLAKFADVSLREVCARIMERYKEVCGEKSVAASLEGDAVIKADPVLMERVMDNFLVNALDHVQDGGIIRICITEHTLECFNSGSHIPEDLIDRIWQPYTKADSSRGSTKGTGLGLAISRSILDLHHFRYGARNQDNGVSFWFTFL
ncbi:MAG: two-component sensor histidine kinase [Paenibacillaceae bacterium]|jgi:signal transduction histidine kinase|nr:two-component sensor histidine kinase [Paenibacillaceae bacterium]